MWKIVGEARARREREREALVVRGHSWGHRRRRRGRICGGGAWAPVTACGRLWGRLGAVKSQRGSNLRLNLISHLKFGTVLVNVGGGGENMLQELNSVERRGIHEKEEWVEERRWWCGAEEGFVNFEP